MEQKSNINPQILQQMLDSATNAAEKGQSQFFTPFELGQQLASALPKKRPAIVDLNCGGTALLQASATSSTEFLFGLDIDPIRPKVEGVEKLRSVNRITYDLTRFYPLAREIDFHAPLFVLNPPWRLWWHRDRLQDLAQSEVTAVRDAFAQQEEAAHRKGTADGTIDSSVATLMIALDLCTYEGEGFVVGNNATWERLIFAPGAPHAALAKHIWGHLVIPGNPMTGIDDCLWEKEQQFHTGVLYFARSHTQGPTRYQWPQLPDRLMRMGSELCRYSSSIVEVDADWDLLKTKVRELNGGAALHPFNLWLSPTGRIRTWLSTFEERSVKVDKKEAERLHKLSGKTPMELVLQRNQRDELLQVVERSGWKVEPALLDAVRKSVADYHSARAPLYPLPDIQRLGYLDEEDSIVCKLDLVGIPPSKKDETAPPRRIFQAGQRYSIRTQTVQVTRTGSKFNSFTGGMDDLEFSGQELAIFISDGLNDPTNDKQKLDEYCFMDQKILHDKNTKVSNTGKRQRDNNNERVQIDFTLQQLADHFEIPTVPDVASTNPEGYKQNLNFLTELETLTESF